MKPPIGTSHRQYVSDRAERDSAFAEAYDAMGVELELALQLVEARERRGMTQRDLAAASGVKQPMIARIERASQSPGPATLVRLLRALQASLHIERDGRVAIDLAEPAESRAL